MPCPSCKNIMVGWVCDACGEKREDNVIRDCQLRPDWRCQGNRCHYSREGSHDLCRSQCPTRRLMVCTLKTGHEGPHIACSGELHDMETWGNEFHRCEATMLTDRGIFHCAFERGHSSPHCSSRDISDTGRQSWDNTTCNEPSNIPGVFCDRTRGHSGDHDGPNPFVVSERVCWPQFNVNWSNGVVTGNTRATIRLVQGDNEDR